MSKLVNLSERLNKKIQRTGYSILKTFTWPFKSKRLLIVRLDAIGDYVLFRNYIHQLKASPQYQEYEITLLGNIIYKELAEQFDADVISEFVWIAKGDLYELYRRIQLVFKLKRRAFDILLNPVHSREPGVDEFIAELGAKHKITSSGDAVNLSASGDLRGTSLYYNEVIPVAPPTTFEYFRNAEFFKILLKTQSYPELKFEVPSKRSNQQVQIVLFPGAKDSYRRWAPQHFAETINIISEQLKARLHVVIAGAESDKVIAETIIESISNKAIVEDYTGLTTLPGLVDTINNADLLITNDTSALHIGAAVKTQTICISNGNHFGRFSPYPAGIANNIHMFYPDERFYQDEYYEHFTIQYQKASDLDINIISAPSVAEKALEILSNKLLTAGTAGNAF